MPARADDTHPPLPEGEAALAALVLALAGIVPQRLDPAGRTALAAARGAALRLVDATPAGADTAGLPDLRGHAVLLAAPGAPTALACALRAAGARVFRAPTTAAALAWLEIAPCDLALLGADLADDGLGPGAARVLAAIRGQQGAPGRAPVLGLGPWPFGGDRLDAVVPRSAPDAVAAALHRVLATAAAELAADGAEEPVVDPVRYGRLIEMAGEDAAQELLDRLGEDLDGVARGLTRALGPVPQPGEIRAHTHVLIALAGAVGAGSLQRLAEALNAAAHRDAPAEIERLGSATLDRLGALLRFLADQSGREFGPGPPHGAAP